MRLDFEGIRRDPRLIPWAPMSYDINQIRETRHAVEAFFRERAAREGLAFHPRVDLPYMDILERLFEETIGDRALYVNVSWGRRGIDAFSKPVPFETGTVDVLTVFIGDDPSPHLDSLWKIYRGWLHRRLTADETMQQAEGPEPILSPSPRPA